MLIATRAYLDKIEGQYNESFEDEEIQLVLNKSQYRLLDDLINKNFQQGTLREQWIDNLQRADIRPVTWIPGGADPDRVGGWADWPVSLYYFIAATAEVQIDPDPPEAYSPYGTQRRYLKDIDISGNGTVTEQRKLDLQITGEALDKEQSMFYGNDYRNPRGEYNELGIRVLRDNSFIIRRLFIDYIEKPADIDVTSPSSTDWPESANEKIVDYTVEYLRLSIQDPSWQANVQDTNLRTQTI